MIVLCVLGYIAFSYALGFFFLWLFTIIDKAIVGVKTNGATLEVFCWIWVYSPLGAFVILGLLDIIGIGFIIHRKIAWRFARWTSNRIQRIL